VFYSHLEKVKIRVYCGTGIVYCGVVYCGTGGTPVGLLWHGRPARWFIRPLAKKIYVTIKGFEF
jgi:hypothetical protein